MDPSLWDLELRCVEPMTRSQLLRALRHRLDCLPPDLRERLDEKPDGWLRLLLLAARLTLALRMLHNAPGGAESN